MKNNQMHQVPIYSLLKTLLIKTTDQGKNKTYPEWMEHFPHENMSNISK